MNTVHSNETIDHEFSHEFAELLAGVLTSLRIGDVEVHERYLVVQAASNRSIYIDVRAVVLEDKPALRRPQRRMPKRGNLRLVQG